MRKMAIGLLALTLAATPALAQMGGGMGGMGGGGPEGSMGGGDMGGGGRPGGGHGGPAGGEEGGASADRKPREMKPISLKAFDKAVEGMFRIADTNHDGMVTLAEFGAVIQARRAAVIHTRFVALDANHDGRIDEAEFTAWSTRQGAAAMLDEPPVDAGEIIPDSITPELGQGERDGALLIAVEPLNPVVIAKANVNYDEGLTLEELLAYEHARFTKADTNQDLFLNAQEIEALQGPRGGGRPGGPMGRRP
jgi:hypothetical protein